jgi:anthranilate 1,2-dioxygenase small subunit
MSDADVSLRVGALYTTYARLIDDGRYDDWLALFVEGCEYRVSPRENLVRGLPLPLIVCDTKDKLRDRIMSLQHANIYNIHTPRHLVANVVVVHDGVDGIEAEADFAVFQTDQEGESRLFVVGRYLSRLVEVNGALCFARQHAVLDTAAVRPLLAVPV